MASKKKTTAKQTITKKKAAPKKKVAAKKKAVPKKKFPGFTEDPVSGLSVPSTGRPVEAKKLARGVEQAKSEIKKLVAGLADITDGYGVSEIELVASFSADGKFLGVGVGGETTIKLKFTPEDTNE